MKSFVAFALLIAGVSASTIRIHDSELVRSEPVAFRAFEVLETHQKRPFIPITSLSNTIRGALQNDLQYQTGNGISVVDNTAALPGRGSMYEDEAGRMVQSDSSLVKSGSYSYTSPEGLPISVSYTADENGFHAVGDHLPKSVPLPAEHLEIHREALARIGLVESSPFLVLREEVAPIRIQSLRAPSLVLRSRF